MRLRIDNARHIQRRHFSPCCNSVCIAYHRCRRAAASSLCQEINTDGFYCCHMFGISDIVGFKLAKHLYNILMCCFLLIDIWYFCHKLLQDCTDWANFPCTLTALHSTQQYPAAPCSTGEDVWVHGRQTGLSAVSPFNQLALMKSLHLVGHSVLLWFLFF